MRERGVPVLDGLLAIPDGTPVAEMKEAYKKLIAEYSRDCTKSFFIWQMNRKSTEPSQVLIPQAGGI